MGRRRSQRGEVPARVTTHRVVLEDGQLYVVETDHVWEVERWFVVDAYKWVMHKEVPQDLSELHGKEAYTEAGGWVAYVNDGWPVRLERPRRAQAATRIVVAGEVVNGGRS